MAEHIISLPVGSLGPPRWLCGFRPCRAKGGGMVHPLLTVAGDGGFQRIVLPPLKQAELLVNVLDPLADFLLVIFMLSDWSKFQMTRTFPC